MTADDIRKAKRLREELGDVYGDENWLRVDPRDLVQYNGNLEEAVADNVEPENFLRENPMSTPRDFNRAVEQYESFHQLPPKEVGTFNGLVLPSECVVVGEAKDILYRSDKWENKSHDYIHDHKPGVKVGRFDMDTRHAGTVVPRFIFGVTTLYRLGVCLGLSYCNFDGEPMEARVKRPYPELYSVPSGKALLIIDTSGSRARLCLALWGGRLDVRDVGIVG